MLSQGRLGQTGELSRFESSLKYFAKKMCTTDGPERVRVSVVALKCLLK